jgi:hypothetical protein
MYICIIIIVEHEIIVVSPLTAPSNLYSPPPPAGRRGFSRQHGESSAPSGVLPGTVSASVKKNPTAALGKPVKLPEPPAGVQPLIIKLKFQMGKKERKKEINKRNIDYYHYY